MSHLIADLTDKDCEAINRAVQQAESRTEAEIVPVVAAISGRYDRGEDLFGLLMGLLLMIVAWYLLPQSIPEPGTWEVGPAWWEAFLLSIAVVAGFLFGVHLASRFPVLAQLLSSSKDKAEEVMAAAQIAFVQEEIHHTQRRAGVLLYLSMTERIVAVIADKVAYEALGQSAINELCQSLTARLRSDSLTEALTAAVEELGQQLQQVLPNTAVQADERPNAVRVLRNAV